MTVKDIIEIIAKSMSASGSYPLVSIINRTVIVPRMYEDFVRRVLEHNGVKYSCDFQDIKYGNDILGPFEVSCFLIKSIGGELV